MAGGLNTNLKVVKKISGKAKEKAKFHFSRKMLKRLNFSRNQTVGSTLTLRHTSTNLHVFPTFSVAVTFSDVCILVSCLIHFTSCLS